MHAKSLLETRQKVRVCVPTAIGNDATRDGARIDLNQTSLRPGSYRVGGGRQRLPLRCVQRFINAIAIDSVAGRLTPARLIPCFSLSYPGEAETTVRSCPGNLIVAMRFASAS